MDELKPCRMEIPELIEELRHYGLSNGGSLGRHLGIMDIAADALERLNDFEQSQLAQVMAENAKLRRYITDRRATPENEPLICPLLSDDKVKQPCVEGPGPAILNEPLKLILDRIHAIPPETFVGAYGNFELVEAVKDSCCEVIEGAKVKAKEKKSLTLCRNCVKAESFQGEYICSEYGGIWDNNDGCSHGARNPEGGD